MSSSQEEPLLSSLHPKNSIPILSSSPTSSTPRVRRNSAGDEADDTEATAGHSYSYGTMSKVASDSERGGDVSANIHDKKQQQHSDSDTALPSYEGELRDEQTYAFDDSRKIGITGSAFLILNKMIGTGSAYIPEFSFIFALISILWDIALSSKLAWS